VALKRFIKECKIDASIVLDNRNMHMMYLDASTLDSILWAQSRQVTAGDELETDRYLIQGVGAALCMTL
jgi:hypothetical protein